MFFPLVDRVFVWGFVSFVCNFLTLIFPDFSFRFLEKVNWAPAKRSPSKGGELLHLWYQLTTIEEAGEGSATCTTPQRYS